MALAADAVPPAAPPPSRMPLLHHQGAPADARALLDDGQVQRQLVPSFFDLNDMLAFRLVCVESKRLCSEMDCGLILGEKGMMQLLDSDRKLDAFLRAFPRSSSVHAVIRPEMFRNLYHSIQAVPCIAELSLTNVDGCDASMSNLYQLCQQLGDKVAKLRLDTGDAPTWDIPPGTFVKMMSCKKLVIACCDTNHVTAPDIGYMVGVETLAIEACQGMQRHGAMAWPANYLSAIGTGILETFVHPLAQQLRELDIPYIQGGSLDLSMFPKLHTLGYGPGQGEEEDDSWHGTVGTLQASTPLPGLRVLRLRSVQELEHALFPPLALFPGLQELYAEWCTFLQEGGVASHLFSPASYAPRLTTLHVRMCVAGNNYTPLVPTVQQVRSLTGIRDLCLKSGPAEPLTERDVQLGLSQVERLSCAGWQWTHVIGNSRTGREDGAMNVLEAMPNLTHIMCDDFAFPPFAFMSRAIAPRLQSLHWSRLGHKWDALSIVNILQARDGGVFREVKDQLAEELNIDHIGASIGKLAAARALSPPTRPPSTHTTRYTAGMRLRIHLYRDDTDLGDIAALSDACLATLGLSPPGILGPGRTFALTCAAHWELP